MGVVLGVEWPIMYSVWREDLEIPAFDFFTHV